MRFPSALLPLLAAATVASAAPPAAPVPSAVLSVSARMARLEFVRGEPVILRGTVRNAGQTALVVDDYGPYLANKITVYLRDSDTEHLLLPKPGAPASAVASLTVRPGEEKPFEVDLSRIFDLPANGRFQATAVVTRGGVDGAPDESATSRRIAFSIEEGVELRSATRSRAGDDRAVLRFALVYWDRAARQELFLRVTDAATGRIAAFFGLGSFVRVAEPTLAFGENDTATIVQQLSRDRFARTVVSYAQGAGKILSRDDNLVSADAFSEAVSARLIAERVDRAEREKEEEPTGFFSRRKTRTEIPAASTGAPLEPIKK